MPNGHIDWKETGALIGVLLGGIALLSKLMSWAPVRGTWNLIKRFGRWLVRAPFKREIKDAAVREVRLTELEAIVVRLEGDITAVGDKVTAALVEIGATVDASVCACRDSIEDLARTTEDKIGELTVAQRGTNRVLQSLVALEVGDDLTRKALAESVFRQEPLAEYMGEDRRARRARGDRPGEEPEPGTTDRRGRPRTRDD